MSSFVPRPRVWYLRTTRACGWATPYVADRAFGLVDRVAEQQWQIKLRGGDPPVPALRVTADTPILIARTRPAPTRWYLRVVAQSEVAPVPLSHRPNIVAEALCEVGSIASKVTRKLTVGRFALAEDYRIFGLDTASHGVAISYEKVH